MYEFILGCFYGGLSIGLIGLIFDRVEHRRKPRRKVTHRVYTYRPAENELPQIFNHRRIEDYVFTAEGSDAK